MWQRSFKYIIILALVIGTSIGHVFGQKKSELERKRSDLNKKINYTSNLISKTASNRKSKQSEVKLLDKQILLRKELIETITLEVAALNSKLEELQDSLQIRKDELERMKASYAELVRLAYKNKNSYNKLMFIFASSDFNQAFRRMKYLNKYTQFRKEQAERIMDQNKAIERNILALDESRKEKEFLLKKETLEKETLLGDKSSKLNKIKALQKQERKLRQDLSKQKKEKSKIDKAIRDLIAGEVAKNKKTAGGKFELTPEAKLLSSKFEQNKGKLPWPVEKGIITERFGRHRHPVLTNVTVENNGVTITTEREANIRAVFNGKVSNVLVIPGSGKVVVLDHGAYRSIYTNLKEVFVTKGMEVTTKESIGTVLPSDESKSEAHLEIWQISGSGSQKLNPENWIFRR